MLTASSANATSSSGWSPLATRGRSDKPQKRWGRERERQRESERERELERGGGREGERDKTERDGTEASV